MGAPRAARLPRGRPGTGQGPLRVVTFGGGTGMSRLLRGLRRLGRRVETTAVVAVSDDGGSSGRLRRELGIPAVGDARACVSALAPPGGWARLLEYRFRRGPLRRHPVGNLLLAAAQEHTGSLSRSLEVLGRLVGVRGRVLPATDATAFVVAQLADGRELQGESLLGRVVGPVERLRLEPPRVLPAPGVLEAIARADLVVFGPGSLFTSVIASALATGVREALERSPARKVLVQNLTTQRGETDGMGVADHVRALQAHLGVGAVDTVLVHASGGSVPLRAVRPDEQGLARLGVGEIRTPLAEARAGGRLHDATLLAQLLYRLGAAHREARPRRALGG